MMILDLFSSGFQNFDALQFLRDLLLSLPAFFIALTFHEAAHAYVAYRCGDPTAKMLGRLTLNPLKHIDPLGLAALFVLGIGWAKPVPVNPRNFKKYRRDDLLVSLAGITANLLLCLFSAVVLFTFIGLAFARLPIPAADKAYYSEYFIRYGFYVNESGAYIGESLVQEMFGSFAASVYQLFFRLALVNVVLAAFNLLPVPPLDGYHLLNDLILRRALFAPQMAMRVGQGLLLLLVITGLLDKGLNVVIGGAFDGLSWLAHSVYTLFQ